MGKRPSYADNRHIQISVTPEVHKRLREHTRKYYEVDNPNSVPWWMVVNDLIKEFETNDSLDLTV